MRALVNEMNNQDFDELSLAIFEVKVLSMIGDPFYIPLFVDGIPHVIAHHLPFLKISKYHQ